jgi:hypothetical protein
MLFECGRRLPMFVERVQQLLELRLFAGDEIFLCPDAVP